MFSSIFCCTQRNETDCTYSGYLTIFLAIYANRILPVVLFMKYFIAFACVIACRSHKNSIYIRASGDSTKHFVLLKKTYKICIVYSTVTTWDDRISQVHFTNRSIFRFTSQNIITLSSILLDWRAYELIIAWFNTEYSIE